jgi:hypothetical protein
LTYLAADWTSGPWLFVVNYSGSTATGHLPLNALRGKKLRTVGSWEKETSNPQKIILIDQWGESAYIRSAEALISGEGLWVSLSPWQCHAFVLFATS